MILPDSQSVCEEFYLLLTIAHECWIHRASGTVRGLALTGCPLAPPTDRLPACMLVSAQIRSPHQLGTALPSPSSLPMLPVTSASVVVLMKTAFLQPVNNLPTNADSPKFVRATLYKSVPYAAAY